MPSWEAAQSEDLLSKWTVSQMLINISTPKFRRSVRLPEGDIPVVKGAAVFKAAVSRRGIIGGMLEGLDGSGTCPDWTC